MRYPFSRTEEMGGDELSYTVSSCSGDGNAGKTVSKMNAIAAFL